jgi:hypothetical protein
MRPPTRRTTLLGSVLLLSTGLLLGQWFQVLPPAFAASSSDFDVKSYGATGNGSTDDTTAIQNAINAAQSAGGGVVFFPKGTYRITSSLFVSGNYVQLEGTGEGSVIWPATSGLTAIYIGNAGGLNLCTNNKVKNLCVHRAVGPAAGSYGIRVERARFINLEGVSVYDSAYGIGVGVPGDGSLNTQFVSIDKSWAKSGTCSDSCLIFFSGADYKVSDSFFEPANRGIVMSGNANGILIDKTTVINGGPFNYGIVSDGTGFCRYIDACILENALQQQVYVGPACWMVSVTDSWIGAGDLNGTTRSGIQIEPGAHHVTVANNRIGDQRVCGLVARGASNLIITGNTFQGNVNSGVAADSLQVEGGKHITITGNRVESGSDRYGIGLYNYGTPMDYFIFSGNDASESGGGYFIGATGTRKVTANNLG